MIPTILGALLIVAGLPFFIRGLLFTTKPEHPVTVKARERNLRLGLDTEMAVWGRKVRRFGFLLIFFGLLLVVAGQLI